MDSIALIALLQSSGPVGLFVVGLARGWWAMASEVRLLRDDRDAWRAHSEKLEATILGLVEGLPYQGRAAGEPGRANRK